MDKMEALPASRVIAVIDGALSGLKPDMTARDALITLRMIYQDMAAAHQPSGEVEGIDPVFAFLLGEGALDGHWFGDTVSGPAFWWRKHLRAAVARLSNRGWEEAIEAAAKVADHVRDHAGELKDGTDSDVMLRGGEIAAARIAAAIRSLAPRSEGDAAK